MAQPQRLLVLVLPNVHVLDLSGPVQAFYEANGFGADYRLSYVGSEPKARSAQGLMLAELQPLPDPEADDLILIPGIASTTLDRLGHVPARWLQRAHERGARLASVCSGAFVLAHAGLLDGRLCTTHWKVSARLRREYPRARVLENRLFVREDRIVTSAGVAAGIDMALAILEEDHGPLLVAQVARELVVYLRRDGEGTQESVYLSYRTHLHPAVHRVQDWLVAHPERRPTLAELGRLAGISPRNLTRVFRRATGISIKDFAQRVKLQLASDLLKSPELKIDAVAASCGFEDARQLRRLWRSAHGSSVSEWRRRGANV